MYFVPFVALEYSPREGNGYSVPIHILIRNHSLKAKTKRPRTILRNPYIEYY